VQFPACYYSIKNSSRLRAYGSHHFVLPIGVTGKDVSRVVAYSLESSLKTHLSNMTGNEQSWGSKNSVYHERDMN